MFNSKARSAIEYAKSFIGVPYKWGGETPMAGYDCCLTQDSLVQTPDGLKKITEFKSGDKVFSYKDGQVVISDVVDVHQNGLKQVYKIKTTSSSLRCTDNHKFLTVKQPEESKKGWTIRKHRNLDWVELKDLKKGDIVVNFNISEQYTFHRITSIVKEGIEETFDLTILNSHSYFANGFVVHNSGYVQEILSSVGLDPVGDQTAQALSDYYVSFGKIVEKPKAGCLVFFGQARIKITHVGFMINRLQMIEAGGGGRQVVDQQSAIDHRAFIRVRPYTYRSDLIYLIDPF